MNWFLGILVALCLAAMVGGIHQSLQEKREWEQYMVDHNCQVVGRKASTTSSGMGITPSGNVAMVVVDNPAQTGFACDDGITYWR